MPHARPSEGQISGLLMRELSAPPPSGWRTLGVLGAEVVELDDGLLARASAHVHVPGGFA